MHALTYIVNGCDGNDLPSQGEEGSPDEECLQEREDQTSSYSNAKENQASSNGTTTISSLKRSESLMKASSPSASWSKILKSLKKFFAYQYFEKPNDPHKYRITPRVMLHGCTTKDEHYEYIEKILKIARGKFSLEGLQASGFTYKFIPCDEHASDTDLCPRETSRPHCTCDKRLVHISTNTIITKNNLKRFVADGEMYEAIVRLCQEHAQELMREEGSLHWVSVCEDVQKGNPIRILVDRGYPIHGKDCHGLENDSIHDDIELQREQEIITNDGADEVETLLITTGKGKVRAGIFSRQHLLVSGIESSTALPMVRDAKQRNMSVAIFDPNARGDRHGMASYEQSMQFLLGSAQNSLHTNSKIGTGPIYILAHSASGSQLTRYLQTDGQHILPRLRSIAFTDSNHSIQWLKNHSQISSFFQSPSTIYIRSSNEDRDDGWEKHKCGDECETDEHWKHRFGKTCTIWAGTTDHSLTNFTSQDQIWAHFDRCRQFHDAENDDATVDSGTCSTCTGIGVDMLNL
jgi:hypothetical protein